VEGKGVPVILRAAQVEFRIPEEGKVGSAIRKAVQAALPRTKSRTEPRIG
jgi:hypothetical protein